MLAAGDRLSADLRIVEAHSLGIDTSTMTGESVPAMLDTGDVALAGTFVVEGEGAGVVIAVGEHTELAGIARLTRALFDDLRDGGIDPLARYERYLTDRSAGYMQLESGAAHPAPPAAWAHLTGYDKIALHTIQAMVHDSNAIIPLNVLNRGNIPDLADDDVIEVPCVVNGNGPHPLHAGALPGQVRALITTVKAYERATIDAYGQAIPLQPGMLLNADVVIDRRSLLEWLFDPIFAAGRR